MQKILWTLHLAVVYITAHLLLQNITLLHKKNQRVRRCFSLLQLKSTDHYRYFHVVTGAAIQESFTFGYPFPKVPVLFSALSILHTVNSGTEMVLAINVSKKDTFSVLLLEWVLWVL